jgi:hypothetical protein
MGDEPAAWRYSAFISYSYLDVRRARALQRSLEDYRLPAALQSSSPLVDACTRKLLPVFRDQDEFSAAPDLSQAIRQAIVQSKYLIVVCTPNAPKSSWVEQEIALARSLHGDGAILAALFEGDSLSAFPASLILDTDGDRLEPLAADFRPMSEGNLSLCSSWLPSLPRRRSTRWCSAMRGAGSAAACWGSASPRS